MPRPERNESVSIMKHPSILRYALRLALIAGRALVVVLVASAGLSIGCVTQASHPSQQRGVPASSIATEPLTAADWEDAEAIVRKHVAALSAGDAAAWGATVGRYKRGLERQANWSYDASKWRGVSVGRVTFPGRFIPEEPPHSYISNFGRQPYRWMTVYVEFEYSVVQPQEAPDGWDYILVKELPDGQWLIHDWGY